MRLYSTFATDSGESYLRQLEIPLEDVLSDAAKSATLGVTHGRISELIPVEGAMFQELDGDLDIPAHPAHHRRFLIILSGAMEIGCSDGTSIVLRPGDAFMANDDTGVGHTVRCPGPVHTLLLPVGPDFNADKYGVAESAVGPR